MTPQDIDEHWFDPETSTFGDRIAGAREAAGMTQSELARRLGVRLATLRGWEDDLSEPRANKLQMMAGLLSVSLGWLLNGEGDGAPNPGEAGELSGDAMVILTEMRDIRVQMARMTERLGQLEKSLRKTLKGEA
ncbi:helix-turn-helix domain-containing protein [Pseudooceanicola sp.]|uniref:helix-turn-helix domain-containing protein n=1 Tax=Pseudooceanicola sp. TaxID=1914328 RepID=UPI002623BE36|nr:helix-turn-helix domain-containing protein [Pseudooceanicola sp.]MDF1853985.1 helix-turn-helix domain-containing protein [Pseudooceanicola sp.]